MLLRGGLREPELLWDGVPDADGEGEAPSSIIIWFGSCIISCIIVKSQFVVMVGW